MTSCGGVLRERRAAGLVDCWAEAPQAQAPARVPALATLARLPLRAQELVLALVPARTLHPRSRFARRPNSPRPFVLLSPGLRTASRRQARGSRCQLCWFKS